MAQTPAQKFDKEADVIVVGLGGAGAATAITLLTMAPALSLSNVSPAATLRSNTRMSGGIFHCPDKTGNKAALKEYARAMFSGENIDWKEEGEIPEYSEVWLSFGQTFLRQTLNSCRAWTRLS